MEEQQITQSQLPAQPSVQPPEQPPAEPPTQQPPGTPVSPKKFPWKKLVLVLFIFLIAIGGVGTALAWRTTYLDDYLPASVKEFFGRGEEPEEKPEEKPAPIISSVRAINITETGATITWTTDIEATSQVEYGATASYGSQTTEDTTLVTSHSVSLSGLTKGTLYHYRVKSKNAAGNLAVFGDFVFTTRKPGKTYRGGYFSIVYPSYWKEWSFGRGIDLEYYQINSISGEKLTPDSEFALISFDIQSESEDKTIEDHRKRVEELREESKPLVIYNIVGEIEVDGHRALVYERIIEDVPQYAKFVWFRTDEAVYSIGLGINAQTVKKRDSLRELYERDFDDIISTMKVID